MEPPGSRRGWHWGAASVSPFIFTTPCRSGAPVISPYHAWRHIGIGRGVRQRLQERGKRPPDQPAATDTDRRTGCTVCLLPTHTGPPRPAWLHASRSPRALFSASMIVRSGAKRLVPGCLQASAVVFILSDSAARRLIVLCDPKGFRFRGGSSTLARPGSSWPGRFSGQLPNRKPLRLAAEQLVGRVEVEQAVAFEVAEAAPEPDGTIVNGRDRRRWQRSLPESWYQRRRVRPPCCSAESCSSAGLAAGKTRGCVIVPVHRPLRKRLKFGRDGRLCACRIISGAA